MSNHFRRPRGNYHQRHAGPRTEWETRFAIWSFCAAMLVIAGILIFDAVAPDVLERLAQ